MRSDAEVLPMQMSVRDAAERARVSQFRTWPVADEGSIVGVLSRRDIESAESDGSGENGENNGAADKKLSDLLPSPDFPHVHADQALHLALERMSAARLDLLPVVNRADVHKLEGIITLRDVLDSYGVDTRGSA
jgi:CIC family chloride channel protein